MENTLRKIWNNGYRLHNDLDLVFKNKTLVSYKVEPEFKHYTQEVVEGIVKDLIDRKMITFFDDIPNMSVSVPIQEIGISSEEGNEQEPLFIETFHHNDDEEDIIDRDCDVPVLLHKYLGFERELNSTDF